MNWHQKLNQKRLHNGRTITHYTIWQFQNETRAKDFSHPQQTRRHDCNSMELKTIKHTSSQLDRLCTQYDALIKADKDYYKKVMESQEAAAKQKDR